MYNVLPKYLIGSRFCLAIDLVAYYLAKPNVPSLNKGAKLLISLLLRELTSIFLNLKENRLHCTLLQLMDTLLFASNYSTPFISIYERVRCQV